MKNTQVDINKGVQKEKNSSRGVNSQKNLKNTLSNVIVSNNINVVNFGQTETTKLEEDFSKNYGHNLIGDYVKKLDGKLYKDIRKEFTSSTDLFNYIIYNRGGLFVKICRKYKKDYVVGFELEDLCQMFFAEALDYSNKERNSKGEIIDLNHETGIVNNILAHAVKIIKNEFYKRMTRDNNGCKISQKQIKNVKKVKEIIKEKVKLRESFSYDEIREELGLDYLEFDELIQMIQYKKSFEYEYKDDEENSITLKDMIGCIENGYEEFEDKYFYGNLEESIIKLNNYQEKNDNEILEWDEYEEITIVDKAIVYLYRDKEIKDDYLRIYKYARGCILTIDEKGKSKTPNFQKLANESNCANETIRKKKLRLYNKLQAKVREIQGGVSLD